MVTATARTVLAMATASLAASNAGSASGTSRMGLGTAVFGGARAGPRQIPTSFPPRSGTTTREPATIGFAKSRSTA